MIAQFEGVSVADVNRVLRTYLDDKRAVVGVRGAEEQPVRPASGGGMAKENNEIPPCQARAAAALGRSTCSTICVFPSRRSRLRI